MRDREGAPRLLNKCEALITASVMVLSSAPCSRLLRWRNRPRKAWSFISLALSFARASLHSNSDLKLVQLDEKLQVLNVIRQLPVTARVSHKSVHGVRVEFDLQPRLRTQAESSLETQPVKIPDYEQNSYSQLPSKSKIKASTEPSQQICILLLSSFWHYFLIFWHGDLDGLNNQFAGL